MKPIWTCYATIWFGLWLLVSHCALGYGGALGWSDSIAGALLIGCGVFSIRRTWAPWAIALISIWLQFAPLIFWTHSPAAYLNDTLIGALVFALSLLIPGMPGRLPDTGPSIPPDWSYNPSSWPQRLPIVILGTIGWFISRYLAAYELGFIDRVWDPVFGDGTLLVITSKVSQQFPISDAGLGAIAYTLEVLFALKGDERRWRTMPWMVALFGLLVIPLGLVSITLIILQPLVVGAWCFLCLVTALCMTIMLPFAIDEVAAALQFLRQREGAFWPLFWKGGPSPGALQDYRTPPLDSSPSLLLRAACWGITMRWNLFLSALLGAFLMLTPWIWSLRAAADYIIGAFAIIVSIASMADLIRKAKYLNLILGAALLLSLIGFCGSLTPLLVQIAIGAALIALSLVRAFS